jgi:hypothetical protein
MSIIKILGQNKAPQDMKGSGNHYDYHGPMLILHTIKKSPVSIIKHLKEDAWYPYVDVGLTVSCCHFIKAHEIKHGFRL